MSVGLEAAGFASMGVNSSSTSPSSSILQGKAASLAMTSEQTTRITGIMMFPALHWTGREWLGRWWAELENNRSQNIKDSQGFVKNLLGMESPPQA